MTTATKANQAARASRLALGRNFAQTAPAKALAAIFKPKAQPEPPRFVSQHEMNRRQEAAATEAVRNLFRK